MADSIWDQEIRVLKELDSGQQYLRIWVPKLMSVVLGRANRKEDYVNYKLCLIDGIDIQKRHGGGGTVLLDKGMIVITKGFILNKIVSPQLIFYTINELIINSLKCLDIDGLIQNGISDICINNKKILGSTLYISQKKFIYQGVLMVSNSLENISKYLKHPPTEPKYRNKRSHNEFLTTLTEENYDYDNDYYKVKLNKYLKYIDFN